MAFLQFSLTSITQRLTQHPYSTTPRSSFYRPSTQPPTCHQRRKNTPSIRRNRSPNHLLYCKYPQARRRYFYQHCAWSEVQWFWRYCWRCDPVCAPWCTNDVDSELQYPFRYVSHRHFHWLIGLANGAIVKFYRFPEHACTCDNIIAAPEYMLVEITEGPGMNIQIPGLPREVVPLSPLKFWYNTGHGRRARLE